MCNCKDLKVKFGFNDLKVKFALEYIFYVCTDWLNKKVKI